LGVLEKSRRAPALRGVVKIQKSKLPAGGDMNPKKESTLQGRKIRRYKI